MITDDLRKRAREAAQHDAEVNLGALSVSIAERWHRIGYESGFAAGYLAHAAQQPSREQIARVLHDDDLDGGRCLRNEQECIEDYLQNADAVLRLLNGEDNA